ncbi:hypothetical protein [Altererythrobacter lutimaris]|uniref:Uncharacterized protein n=1 Tax=Altererythrobacter lutimaris TaxID=2743979 RepID=A0A850HHI7_9SPHN|nr:hypothetical protein [Altererythrobacter lutimaris]NVE94552.1 hypothetical protein [Altererythrobacter lutimaris]
MPENAKPLPSKALATAFWLNFIWINVSEVARYFLVVRPLLRSHFPDQPQIGAMNHQIFAIWGVWDLVLILAAIGFYWLWLERFGQSLRQLIAASLAFTLTVFGLLWIGVANMGLAPFSMVLAALPLAWVEQLIACWIVAWSIRRYHPSASIRSM